ncbi:hypothetical protein ACFWOT_09310 [Streptomyces sp. NPDC058440]|uniref:hypothetical protein n=1 Tax=Streptomyces sp. NPDC058440 TaxID=3346501 RepID=UPI00364CF40C
MNETKSKWKPGTRVRVKAGIAVVGGQTGVIEDVSYAKHSEETSVLLDDEAFGAWFADDELEAL